MVNGHLNKLRKFDRARFIRINPVEERTEILFVGHALHVMDQLWSAELPVIEWSITIDIKFYEKLAYLLGLGWLDNNVR